MNVKLVAIELLIKPKISALTLNKILTFYHRFRDICFAGNSVAINLTLIAISLFNSTLLTGAVRTSIIPRIVCRSRG